MFKKIPKADLKLAYRDWWYTIVGAGGDSKDWITGYEKWLEEEKIGKPKCWFYCKGEDVNKKFRLEEQKNFPDDLVFLFFPLDGLDTSKLAIFKIRLGDHWFTDIIDNNKPDNDDFKDDSFID